MKTMSDLIKDNLMIFHFYTIGYRKVWHVLKQQGIPVRLKTVTELVREIDLITARNRKKRKLKRRILL